MDTMDCENRLEGESDEGEVNLPSSEHTVRVKMEDDIDIVHEELRKEIFVVKQECCNHNDIFNGSSGFCGCKKNDTECNNQGNCSHDTMHEEDSKPSVKQDIDHFEVQTQTLEELKKFHCTVCSKPFIRKGHLTRHLKIHSGETFRCDTCSKSFSSKEYLAVHLRRHSGRGLFRCDVCSKTFTTNNHLIRHSMIHSGERPFQCSVCSKSFIEKATLNIHCSSHSEEKLFTCGVCSKSFTCKKYLTQHLVIHSAVRSFHCDICSKSFIAQAGLTRHKKTHNRKC